MQKKKNIQVYSLFYLFYGPAEKENDLLDISVTEILVLKCLLCYLFPLDFGYFVRNSNQPNEDL